VVEEVEIQVQEIMQEVAVERVVIELHFQEEQN
jgi:hypothetical protein